MSAETEYLKLDTIEKNIWEKIAGGGEDSKLLTCEATITQDSETGKQTITLDKTVTEVYAAAIAGKNVQFTTIFSGMEITGVIPMEVFRFVDEEGDFYIVKARADSNSSDKLYISNILSGDDIVSLTEV